MIRADVNTESAVRRLAGVPGKVAAEVEAEVKRQTMSVLALAKQKVSGEVLKNRTGTLRRKVNARFERDGGGFTGAVGIKLSYAAAHEFGFDGTVTVKAHVRRVGIRQVLMSAKDAWAQRQGDNRGIGRRRVEVHASLAQVREHKRRMILPKRSFLRAALAERREAIAEGIAAAVKRGLE